MHPNSNHNILWTTLCLSRYELTTRAAEAAQELLHQVERIHSARTSTLISTILQNESVARRHERTLQITHVKPVQIAPSATPSPIKIQTAPRSSTSSLGRM